MDEDEQEQEHYPDSPGYKAEGPSRESAEKITSRAETLRGLVAALLQGQELTADECALHLGESVLAVRPRLSELHAAGRIMDSGRRRRNASGHNATVWRWINGAVQQEVL